MNLLSAWLMGAAVIWPVLAILIVMVARRPRPAKVQASKELVPWGWGGAEVDPEVTHVHVYQTHPPTPELEAAVPSLPEPTRKALTA